MTRAYVGLGANLGPREDTLREAVGILGRADGIEVVAISTLRETEPVGPVEQPMFLNGAVELETTLSARELLDLLLDAERALGRIRAERWGPRVVDLDLLAYGEEEIHEPGLEVPHPRLQERRFALEPLAELAPELDIPGRGRVSDLLAELD